MNTIISSFYLITLDGRPSYVGYTNRPIKTRFNEHKRDKDFGNAEVSLENLGRLEYDFTWDEELINSHAKEVSNRETELIEKYGTQSSVWQKGLGTAMGGQTWANIKYFVRTNRDNPKFRGMSEDAILAYLETSNKVSRYMKSFVANMGDSVSNYMKNFVSSMYVDPIDHYLRSFVNNMDDPVSVYVKGFIHHMEDPVETYMRSFVSHMISPAERYMRDMVKDMEPVEVTYMKNFVKHMKI